MARVTIEHSCGHEEEHKIPFSATSKRGRAHRAVLADGVCPECYEKWLNKPSNDVDHTSNWDDDSPEHGSPATF